MTYQPRNEGGTPPGNGPTPREGSSGAAMFAIGLVIVAIALLIWFFVANNDNSGTQTTAPTATTLPSSPTTSPSTTQPGVSTTLAP
ncbi:MAG TPA: hypothetical protein VID03_04500 [Acidimicrobiia bacterium]|jgi:hypothetical protein